MMRWLQPDTLIPQPNNPQSLNRYSYVTNRPINFNDPTGHIEQCEGQECDRPTVEEQLSSLKKTIKDKFKWKVKGNDWSLDELRAIYQTGHDVESYIDNLTDGKGNEWIKRNVGNTVFAHASWDDYHAETWPWFGGSKISLGDDWLNNPIWKPNEHIAHELGHVWDVHTGFAASSELMYALGGQGIGYFGKPENVPQWNPRVHNVGTGAYGNTKRNDYFAEAFSVTIYSPELTPPGVSAWIDAAISNPAFPPPVYYPWISVP